MYYHEIRKPVIRFVPSVLSAYRKAALEHHPDKAGAAVADEDTKRDIEERFKSIQDAYETLSDPARRREYDSVDDFDDTLPMDCASEDFFKVLTLPPHQAGTAESNPPAVQVVLNALSCFIC